MDWNTCKINTIHTGLRIYQAADGITVLVGKQAANPTVPVRAVCRGFQAVWALTLRDLVRVASMVYLTVQAAVQQPQALRQHEAHHQRGSKASQSPQWRAAQHHLTAVASVMR